MIKTHSLNLKESKAVFSLLESRIQRHMCYINIWNVFRSYEWKFIRNDWRIAYGYVSIIGTQNLLARHCFIVDRKGKAIDPTIFRFDNDKENEVRKYISFKVLDKYEYLECIEKDDYNPSLYTTILPAETEMWVWAKENGMRLLGAMSHY